jgi:hypothetical protein
MYVGPPPDPVLVEHSILVALIGVAVLFWRPILRAIKALTNKKT